VSQALTSYEALAQSLRTRARQEPALVGIDKLAGQLGLKLRTTHTRISALRKQAQSVMTIGTEIKTLGEAALDSQIAQIREKLIRGTHDLPTTQRALAIVREVIRRETSEEAYEVQIIGALALQHGCIIEMLTGEGKTLTGSLAAPLIAWKKRKLHILTVNDYLATRDAQSRAPIYRRCLLDCGAIAQELEPHERFAIYAKPIVYGTPKQINADFLRDQIRLTDTPSAWAGRSLLAMGDGSMAGVGAGPMVPGLHAGMVDEADAVLIDEGVVPLIIAQSRRGDEMAEIYKTAANMARSLSGSSSSSPDYTIDLLRKRAELTAQGRTKCAALFAAQPQGLWRATRRAEELIRQALVARHCYLHGQHYQIVEDKIVIVDEYTGRFLPDRSWEHGLHQAVEAKENVEVTADRETLARLSFQKYLRMYPFLCGMTGTAADATVEIERVYQRVVARVPTNKPIARIDLPPRVFTSASAKWDGVVEQVKQIRAQGRPVLVGTRSVEASQRLAELLTRENIEHKVLNALFDKDEASIIRNAGDRGVVTVATNMAGRGTDIKLPPDVHKAGGLHVILTEMHGAQRIDRQFRGRAGRQGDPGSSQMFMSLEDELIRLHAPKLGSVLASMGSSAGELSGVAYRLARVLFAHCQSASQNRARRQRLEVLKQDNWIDKHLPGS
jgi:preprotein translocase subunit SecA